MKIEKENIIVDISNVLLYSANNQCNKADPENLNAFLRWRKKFESKQLLIQL